MRPRARRVAGGAPRYRGAGLTERRTASSAPLAPAARFRGALVGVAVGDALGAPFEGHRGPVPAALLSRLDRAEGWLRYTDDTAMTFALAESLLFCHGLDLDHLAGTFAVAYEREPHRGYGPGTAELLGAIAAGAPWRESAAAQFGGSGSYGNGAAMRVAPLALHARGSVEEAARLARESAMVTHTHPDAVDAAGVQAGAVALALADDPPDAPGPFVARVREVAALPRLRAALDAVSALHPEATPAKVAAVTGTGVAAAESVPAAVAAAALNLRSFPAAIRFAVALGGDTDTIASMAGAIVGARLGDGAVPPSWAARVEGVASARELAEQLAAGETAGGHPPPC